MLVSVANINTVLQGKRSGQLLPEAGKLCPSLVKLLAPSLHMSATSLAIDSRD